MRADEQKQEEDKDQREQNPQWEQIIRPESKDLIQKVIRNIVLLPFCMGYTMIYFNSFKFQQLMAIFHITLQKSFAQGLLTSCIPLGACIGAILSKLILDIYSRKDSFCVLNVINIVGILMIQTKLLSLVIVGRILQGVFIGSGLAIVPLYIKQFLPQMNGRYGIYNQLLFSAGIICGFGLNLVLHQILKQSQHYWRVNFIFPLVISLLQTYRMMSKFNYETPRYLITKRRNQDALIMLKMLYKQNHVQKQYQMLYQAVHYSSPYHHRNEQRLHQNKLTTQRQRSPKIASTIIIEQQQQQQSVVGSQQLNISSNDYSLQNLHQQEIQPIVNSDNIHQRKLTHTLAIVCALHLSFHRQIIGIGAVNLYAADIVKDIFPQSLFYYYTVIVQTVGILFVFLGLRLVKSYGRAKLIQAGSITVLILLILISANFLLKQNGSQWIIIISIVLLKGAFNCTLGPIYWIYMAEIVKPNIIPYGTLINQLGSSMVIFLFPIMTNLLGNPGWIFLFNALLCVISIVINYFTLVETKDKYQLTIWQDFDKKLTNFKNHQILKYFRKYE